MNFSKLSMKFLPGIVLSASVFALYSFGSTMLPEGEPVTEEIAKSYCNDYKANPPENEPIVSPFFANTEQIRAMEAMISNNGEYSGVRVYPGLREGATVGVLIGVDANNRDIRSDTYNVTGLVNSGTCPPLCDANSPIGAE